MKMGFVMGTQREDSSRLQLQIGRIEIGLL
jgi:hypothetical protein